MARKPATPAPDPEPLQDPNLIKKPEFIDQVVARTNLKKRDVKPAVEAAFAVLVEVLQEGKEVNVPPLGKVRVVKSKPLESGAAVMTIKLRTPKNASVAVTGDDDA